MKKNKHSLITMKKNKHSLITMKKNIHKGGGIFREKKKTAKKKLEKFAKYIYEIAKIIDKINNTIDGKNFIEMLDEYIKTYSKGNFMGEFYKFKFKGLMQRTRSAPEKIEEGPYRDYLKSIIEKREKEYIEIHKIYEYNKNIIKLLNPNSKDKNYLFFATLKDEEINKIILLTPVSQTNAVKLKTDIDVKPFLPNWKKQIKKNHKKIIPTQSFEATELESISVAYHIIYNSLLQFLIEKIKTTTTDYIKILAKLYENIQNMPTGHLKNNCDICTYISSKQNLEKTIEDIIKYIISIHNKNEGTVPQIKFKHDEKTPLSKCQIFVALKIIIIKLYVYAEVTYRKDPNNFIGNNLEDKYLRSLQDIINAQFNLYKQNIYNDETITPTKYFGMKKGKDETRIKLLQNVSDDFKKVLYNATNIKLECKHIGCSLKKTSEYDYCPIHLCEYNDCKKSVYVKYLRIKCCKKHMCKKENCRNTIFKENALFGGDYCYDHICKAIKCFKEKKEDGNYCNDHTCLGLIKIDVNTHVQCKNMRIVTEGKFGIGISYKKYCNKHMCNTKDCVKNDLYLTDINYDDDTFKYYCDEHKTVYILEKNNKKDYTSTNYYELEGNQNQNNIINLINETDYVKKKKKKETKTQKKQKKHTTLKLNKKKKKT